MPYPVMPPALREHISFSQLQLAANCGEAYRRRYIEGDALGPMNVPALCGTAFHEAVVNWELMYEGYHVITPKTETLIKDLLVLTKAAIRHILDETGTDSEDLIYWGKQDLPYWFREKLEPMCEMYVSRRVQEWRDLDFRWGLPDYHAGSANMSLEVTCELEVAGHPFIAYIDQVFCDSQKRTVIRDIKTGKPKPGHAMQLEVYRYALEKSHGIKADYGQLLYLHRKSEPYIQVVDFGLDDTEVKRLVGRLVRNLNDGVFLVNGPFNGHCDVCDFRTKCSWGGVGTHGSS